MSATQDSLSDRFHCFLPFSFWSIGVTLRTDSTLSILDSSSPADTASVATSELSSPSQTSSALVGLSTHHPVLRLLLSLSHNSSPFAVGGAARLSDCCTSILIRWSFRQLTDHYSLMIRFRVSLVRLTSQPLPRHPLPLPIVNSTDGTSTRKDAVLNGAHPDLAIGS